MTVQHGRVWLVCGLLGLGACSGKEQGITHDSDDNGGGGGGGDDTGGGGGGGGSTDIAGDTVAEAYAVSWEKDTSGFLMFEVEETIGRAGDRDFYAMEMTAGQIVFLASLAYGLTGSTEPDTVLRLYDSEGNFLAENDDMPYRLLETDSGLYFQATTSGTYYAEVLEWSDWDEGSDAVGGDDFEYLLRGVQYFTYEAEPTNDTPEGISAYVAKEGNYAYIADPVVGEYTMMWGDISKEGDEDYYPLTIDADDGSGEVAYDALFYSVSFWGQPLGALSPEVTLVNDAGEILAQTHAPMFGVERRLYYNYANFFSDFGLLTYLEPGDYYIRVKDTGSSYGVGTFYAGILAGYYDTLALPINDNPNDDIEPGTSLTMEPFTSKTGYGGAVYGSFTETVDELDSWSITPDMVNGLAGKYLSVYVMAEQYGSLVDTMVSIYDSNGVLVSSEITNTFDGGADPEITDLELSDDGGVFVVVEPEALSEHGLANHYILYVTVSDEPLQVSSR